MRVGKFFFAPPGRDSTWHPATFYLEPFCGQGLGGTQRFRPCDFTSWTLLRPSPQRYTELRYPEVPRGTQRLFTLNIFSARASEVHSVSGPATFHLEPYFGRVHGGTQSFLAGDFSSCIYFGLGHVGIQRFGKLSRSP